MVFVFDLDDTICDTDGFSETYILNFFKENNMPYKKIASSTRYAESKFDWDNKTALSWYKKYGDEMMLNFPPKPKTVKIINDLYDHGHTIIFATARSTDWHTEPELVTKNWLKNNNIKYSKLYINSSSKELICEKENADVFVDDDLKITATVNQLKNKSEIKVFLMTSNFNKSADCPDGVIRINNLSEILNFISLPKIDNSSLN